MPTNHAAYVPGLRRRSAAVVNHAEADVILERAAFDRSGRPKWRATGASPPVWPDPFSPDHPRPLPDPFAVAASADEAAALVWAKLRAYAERHGHLRPLELFREMDTVSWPVERGWW